MPTTDKRKERYHQVVLGKATGVYASWSKNGMTSKGLVSIANAYAFDKRLKTDAIYRFRALVFACALGMRVEKRYAKFLQKLFHLFAFLRERNALASLKRVLGFQVEMDIWEMISIELEKLSVLLSQRNNEETTGGGRRSEMGDFLSEDALEDFLAEVEKEEMQKTGDKSLTDGKTDEGETHGEQMPVETESEREQISVEELEPTRDGALKKQASTKGQATERLNKEGYPQKETPKDESQASPMEKTLGNPAAFVGTIELEQSHTEEIPFPFPIFRENGKEGSVQTSKDTSVEGAEQSQLVATEKVEGAERSAVTENGQDKDLFPVFKGEQGGSGGENKSKPEQSTDKTLEKDVERLIEKEVKEEQGKPDQVKNLSEENKARYALMNSLSEQEIRQLVDHVKEMARLTMEQEEAAGREQFSVTQSSNDTQMSEQVSASKQNDGAILQNAKK